MSKTVTTTHLQLLTETNFLLDIAFDQSPECKRLFFLAQEQNIPIIVPEYSFAEAEGNIAKTLEQRLAAIDTTIGILKQSARSAYQDVAALLAQLHAFKARSDAEERPLLHLKLAKLEEHVSVIPFSAKIGARAELRGLRQLAPWKPTDRNVYESLLHFVRKNQASEAHTLFLTRDRADFDVPSLHDELAALSVELLFSAGDGIRRIRELLQLNASS